MSMSTSNICSSSSSNNYTNNSAKCISNGRSIHAETVAMFRPCCCCCCRLCCCTTATHCVCCKVISRNFIWLPAKYKTDECSAKAPAACTRIQTHIQAHTHTLTRACTHTAKHTDNLCCKFTHSCGWFCCCGWGPLGPFLGAAGFRCLVLDINEVESESVFTAFTFQLT